MKVVINVGYGGYSLSEKAYQYLGIPWDNYGFKFRGDRTNPKLIEVVEQLGRKANGLCANLKVIEVLDDVDWYIDDYDGWESIHEKHEKHESWG